MRLKQLVTWLTAAIPVALAASAASTLGACGVDSGSGDVEGTLNVDQCWQGPFNLSPDFFAADPYRDTLTIRIQNGSDYETFSDGLEILVDSITLIRGDATHPSHLCHGGTSCDELTIGLSSGVTEPGIPLQAVADPSIVHLTVYLNDTCHTQNSALYALDKVSLGLDGNCDETTEVNTTSQCGVSGVDLVDGGTDGGDVISYADGGSTVSTGGSGGATDAGVTDGGGTDAGTTDAGVLSSTSDGPIGRSWIVFDELFDGNEDDESASSRLSEGHFDVFLADPREVCSGGYGPPPRCKGHLKGDFKFYFQTGRPAQAFPSTGQ